MVDLSDKESQSEEMSSQSDNNTNVKTCVDCGTSKTPLWRGGPAGPKSLCNACGIRSRKKRRALLGVTKEEKKTKKPSKNNSGNQSSSSNSCTSSSGDSTTRFNSNNNKNNNKNFWDFGVRDVGFQRPRSNTGQRRKLGEEEQAAFLLMALSCGSVYA